MEKKYVILRASMAVELSEKANEFVNQGFIPCGNLFLNSENGSLYFYQALYKPTEKDCCGGITTTGNLVAAPVVTTITEVPRVKRAYNKKSKEVKE